MVNQAASHNEAHPNAGQKNSGNRSSISSVSTSITLPRGTMLGLRCQNLSEDPHSPTSSSQDGSSATGGDFTFIQVQSDDSSVCHDAPTASSESTSDDDSPLPRSVSDPVNGHRKASKEACQSQRAGPAIALEELPALTVKNGFIHCIGDEEPPPAKVLDWFSCPAKFVTGEHHTIYPLMEDNHVKGDCRPCAYFLTRDDGCRAGGDCNFCHLCTGGIEKVKQKKKEKVKKLKEKDRLAKQAASKSLEDPLLKVLKSLW